MSGLFLNMTEFILSMTGVFLNITGFVLSTTGFALNMTGSVLDTTGFVVLDWPYIELDLSSLNMTRFVLNIYK